MRFCIKGLAYARIKGYGKKKMFFAKGTMQRKHLCTVISCYVLWGVLPLYWRLLADVDSALVLCGRLVFGLLFCLALMGLRRELGRLRALLRDKAAMKHILIATPLICVNWTVYMWAMQTGRTIDASLGYYLNPLFVFAFSVLIFKEQCGRFEIAALAIAAAGVALSMLLFGSFPIVTLVLGFCFAAYGVCKKKAHADPIASITVETLLSAPFFLLYALLFQREGAAALGFAWAQPARDWTCAALLGAAAGLSVILCSGYGARIRREDEAAPLCMGGAGVAALLCALLAVAGHTGAAALAAPYRGALHGAFALLCAFAALRCALEAGRALKALFARESVLRKTPKAPFALWLTVSAGCMAALAIPGLPWLAEIAGALGGAYALSALALCVLWLRRVGRGLL